MFSKTWIFNILFLAIIVFLGIKTHEIWTKKEKEVVVPQDVPRQQAKVYGKKKIKRVLPESSYRRIVKNNLFSPDRAEYVLKEQVNVTRKVKPAPPGKKIVVAGIFIAGEYKKALVRWFDVKQSVWKTEGETIGEMRLVSIQERSIILAKEGKRYEVRIYDKIKTGRNRDTKKNIRPDMIESKNKPPVEKVSETGKSSKGTKKRIKAPFGMSWPGKKIDE